MTVFAFAQGNVESITSQLDTHVADSINDLLALVLRFLPRVVANAINFFLPKVERLNQVARNPGSVFSRFVDKLVTPIRAAIENRIEVIKTNVMSRIHKTVKRKMREKTLFMYMPVKD